MKHRIVSKKHTLAVKLAVRQFGLTNDVFCGTEVSRSIQRTSRNHKLCVSQGKGSKEHRALWAKVDEAAKALDACDWKDNALRQNYWWLLEQAQDSCGKECCRVMKTGKWSEWSWGGATEEGYHSESYQLSTDKWGSTLERHSDGRDCDGRMEYFDEYILVNGKFVNKHSHQRDYTAEAMGY